MFLEYGVSESGQLVHISQAPRGRVPLTCPYCGQGLLAKKGPQLEHHFAHDGDTFRESQRDFDALALPIYDRFNIHIPADTWIGLQHFHETGRTGGYRQALLEAELIRERFGQQDGYELTQQGKIPFGEATLSAFADFQQGRGFRRHNDLQDTVRDAHYGIPRWRSRKPDGWTQEPAPEMVQPALTDLHIYRAQVRRLYHLHLYLLRIEHTAGMLYKIGATHRRLGQRVSEIEAELSGLLSVKRIQGLRLCRNRGAVERYAHHRYRDYQAQVGSFQEYFDFNKATRRNVLSDFTRLGDLPLPDGDERRVWSGEYHAPGLIASILADEAPEIEMSIAEDTYKEAHSAATRAGMQAAQEAGVHVGRPQETHDVILEKYPDVIRALEAGLSLRKAAAEAGVSVNTVRKVKALLDG